MRNLIPETTLELRLSRLFYKMGYFVRRNVPLSSYTPGDYATRRVDITDIDVLGIQWDEDLRPDWIVCECKSGSQAKPLDRCFWLSGVMNYFGARRGYLTTTTAGEISRSVGQKMNIMVVDETTLQELEKRHDIKTDDWFGYFSPGIEKEILEFRKTLKTILPAQLNYLVYGYWKDPDYYQIKRLIAIGKSAAKVVQTPSDALDWFSFETLCRLTSSLVTFCHRLYASDSKRLGDEMSVQLIGGILSKVEREGIAKSVVKLMQSYVKEEYNDKFPVKWEELRLDPDYMDKLVELVSRLINRPHETCMLSQFMDLACFEFLRKRKAFSEDNIRRYFGSSDIVLLAKLAKNVVKFYLDATSTKTNLYDPLSAF